MKNNNPKPTQGKTLTIKSALLFLTILFLAAGCLPAQQATQISDGDKIATFVAATQTAALPQQEGMPTGTPTTKPLEQGDTPLPTETPTSTFTPTPTLTPTVTLTPTLAPDDPVLSLGSPSFRDNFENGDNFYLYDDAQASYQVDDDRMVLIAKKANSYETWSLSWEELKNFYLEITGEFGSECSGKDRYGMIFRAPDTSQGYLISITCDGSYRLSTWESDVEEYTSIKKWTQSQHINSGPGGANRLGIMVKNSKLTGFINGHQVFELNDSTFTKGRFGVMVAASNTPGFTAYLTQAAYWKLP
jgi:hypothetical protein